jgi:hypothetical protein
LENKKEPNDYLSKVFLQKKREQKKYRRLRKKKKYRGYNTTIHKIEKFKIAHDEIILSKFNFEIDNYLNRYGGVSTLSVSETIKIPNVFSLERNYNESIDVLWQLRKTIYPFSFRQIIIDFSDCKKIDFGILFLTKVVLEEYIETIKKLQKKLVIIHVISEIKINPSKVDSVNFKLLANNLITSINAKDDEFIPISTLNLIKGTRSQKHYAENKKGSATTKIRRYINEGLKRHSFILSNKGEGLLDGLISEILNNAEDHSPFNTWYAFGNLFETNPKSQPSNVVGEINLAFLNFGYSIYDGFELTQEDNFEVYSDMEKMHHIVKHNSLFTNKLTKENLFTLYALQEGFSRLRYLKESRGTGTMKFITSFLELGDYQDVKKDFIPRLLIYSGNTCLKCDNKFKPFCIDDVYYLSLNSEGKLTLPPENSHLFDLDYRFPGTLLIVKIYLNKNHLNVKNGNYGPYQN